MTSMPLTLRRMFGATLCPCLGTRPPSAREGGMERSARRAAVRRGAPAQLLAFGVLVSRLLDHRLDDLLVGVQPVGGEVPLRAVPGLHPSPVGADVVDAAGADRAHHAGKAERVELLLVEREI